MPLRKFLKDLPQTQETVDKLNYEIERGEQIIRFQVSLLRDRLLSSLERKKAEESIAYEEGYIKEIGEVRTEIRIILANGK